tara:strand:- start:994 stop:1410 length:417 start_codon:yes stop_codon:yes gene_type:complete
MKNKTKFLKNSRNSYKVSKNVFYSLKYAFFGLSYCFQSTRNFRIQIFLGLLAIAFCLIINCNKYEFISVIATIFSVLILELINTAIETLVDLSINNEYNKLAKIAKDCSAASVLLASINSIFVAAFIFIPKIRLLLFN